MSRSLKITDFVPQFFGIQITKFCKFSKIKIFLCLWWPMCFDRCLFIWTSW